MHTVSRQRSTAALAALSLAGVLTLTGCGADGAVQGTSADKAAVAPAPAQGGKAPEAAKGAGPAAAPGSAASGSSADKNAQPPAAVRPNVIRTATLGIETADAQQALAAARSAAQGAGGYVGNESSKRGQDGRMTSTLTLRVPGERYDAVLGAMEGSGKLLHRKVEAQDVTEKVADIGSRVASQQASVARVREMMGKASALSDVVMLESELSKRQSDLESLLAQQNALKDQTALGTITLEVSEPAPKPVAEEKKKEKEPAFMDALRGGWGVFMAIVRFLTLAVGAVLPFALAAGALALGFRLYRRLRPAKPKADRAPRTGPAWRVSVPAARPGPADAEGTTGADAVGAGTGADAAAAAEDGSPRS
ncbi:DUF4349 domain-containing protein [Streptomyces sp. NBC_01408]|uniref:DUF4349 domain-containing protein n=1 Tax=Streptomyces sp. NBC_01408 TaxID=2903855 RepID=UPI00224D6340|nr:DUF4349 domain-containing protein [Streptomyces sp. NBC_01408]MCX4696345.1 DUF4349 domain-containing protein [Streptomyces sp. NBC_01408]